MHPHEIHHLKAYIVFFIVSALLIGGLIYLYVPTASLSSSALEPVPSLTASEENVAGDSSEGETTSNVVDQGASPASQERIRFTARMLRYQRELKLLTEERSVGDAGLDQETEKRIEELQKYIADLQQKITELTERS